MDANRRKTADAGFRSVRHYDLHFFFSSRRRHTRSLCDWSSDVCSSDLIQPIFLRHIFNMAVHTQDREASCPAEISAVCRHWRNVAVSYGALWTKICVDSERSEERRVGKECRSRWSPYH